MLSKLILTIGIFFSMPSIAQSQYDFVDSFFYQETFERSELVKGNIQILGRGIENTETGDSFGFACVKFSNVAQQLFSEKPICHQKMIELYPDTSEACDAVRAFYFRKSTQETRFITDPITFKNIGNNYLEGITYTVAYLSGYRLDATIKMAELAFDKDGWNWSIKNRKISPGQFFRVRKGLEFYNHSFLNTASYSNSTPPVEECSIHVYPIRIETWDPEYCIN